MARWLYSLFFYLATPFILLRLWRRAKQAPAYADRVSERFGIFKARPPVDKFVVWLHTVSVGEFIGAQPLIKALLARPDLHLVITTMTPTGSAQVERALGDRVTHVYAPYDTPSSVARFLSRIKPNLFLTMETELWPNTLAACRKRSIPCLLINGRLSARSLKGYQKFAWLTRPMLANLTRAAIQNTDDAARFKTLGLTDDQLLVTGNIKFDLTLADEVRAQAAEFRAAINPAGAHQILIAASTHAGEDDIILQAFSELRRTHSAVRLVLVPRHPERFDAVFNLCQSYGFSVARRSESRSEYACDILLGDTMGELLALYGGSDIAFVGGSLVPNGGHNFIEAAVWGLPLISGPHLFNFAEVARLLADASALTQVADAQQLCEHWTALLNDNATAKARGARAQVVAEANRGALATTLAAIDNFLPRRV